MKVIGMLLIDIYAIFKGYIALKVQWLYDPNKPVSKIKPVNKRLAYDPSELLDQLQSMQPLSIESKHNSLERWCHRYSMQALKLAGFMFLLLLALVLWHLHSPLPAYGVLIAQILILVSTVLSFLSMIISSLPGLWLPFRFKKVAHDGMLKDQRHDRLQASKLRGYHQNELEQAIGVLRWKQEQIQSRIGSFIGSSEKLALFSIIGFGLTVWDKLSDQKSSLNKLIAFKIPYSHWTGLDIVMLFLGGAAGLLLGGALSRN
ncbi:hypothetical protein [Chromobacterium amazonense]|uniref:hypothetical protein n=1 Tax=Chromobacterium amazonense TaxID=1382803 RepID=UPI0011B27E4D|nr:hypothetical protein [Chromobacterium amazonense]